MEWLQLAAIPTASSLDADGAGNRLGLYGGRKPSCDADGFVLSARGPLDGPYSPRCSCRCFKVFHNETPGCGLLVLLR